MKQRQRCFMDIEVAGVPMGRIVVELFNDTCPITSENFRALCEGDQGVGKTTGKTLHYLNSIFHRVVKGFVIQGGDFSASDGTGGESIYGGVFCDEDLSTKHDVPFLLSMANYGKDSNGSQFFFTTGPAPHLDGKNVVFGQVKTGQEILRYVDALPVDRRSRPLQDVKIVRCGELVRKLKRKHRRKSRESQAESSEEEAKEEVPSPKKSHKKKHSHKEKRAAEPAVPTEEGEISDSADAHPLVPVLKKIDIDEIPEVPFNRLLRGNPEREAAMLASAGEASNRPRHRLGRQPGEGRQPRIKAGVKIKGRGVFRWHGMSPEKHSRSRSRSRSNHRSRSTTPPHWREAQRRTIKLSEFQRQEKKRAEREADRALREKERARREKERVERSAARLREGRDATKEKQEMQGDERDAAAAAKNLRVTVDNGQKDRLVITVQDASGGFFRKVPVEEGPPAKSADVNVLEKKGIKGQTGSPNDGNLPDSENVEATDQWESAPAVPKTRAGGDTSERSLDYNVLDYEDADKPVHSDSGDNSPVAPVLKAGLDAVQHLMASRELRAAVISQVQTERKEKTSGSSASELARVAVVLPTSRGSSDKRGKDQIVEQPRSKDRSSKRTRSHERSSKRTRSRERSSKRSRSRERSSKRTRSRERSVKRSKERSSKRSDERSAKRKHSKERSRSKERSVKRHSKEKDVLGSRSKGKSDDRHSSKPDESSQNINEARTLSSKDGQQARKRSVSSSSSSSLESMLRRKQAIILKAFADLEGGEVQSSSNDPRSTQPVEQSSDVVPATAAKRDASKLEKIPSTDAKSRRSTSRSRQASRARRSSSSSSDSSPEKKKSTKEVKRSKHRSSSSSSSDGSRTRRDSRRRGTSRNSRRTSADRNRSSRNRSSRNRSSRNRSSRNRSSRNRSPRRRSSSRNKSSRNRSPRRRVSRHRSPRRNR